MNILSVEDLRVYFHTRHGIIRAVDGISYELQKGTTLGIVGESGSGKSVACQSLMGLLPTPPARVESGRAVFNGVDLLRAGEDKLRGIRGNKVAMIFQDPMTSLNPYMTIGAQLTEPLRIHMNLSRRDARARAINAMEEVGISNPGRRINCYPFEFSGGMRQRVMIAMALLTNPEILIADEPTTALDVTIQAQILDLIKKIQREHNLSVIFITHDLGVIAGIADQVLVMHHGKIIEQGTVEDIFYNCREAYTQNLLDSIPSSGKPQAFEYQGSSGSEKLLSVNNLKTYFQLRRGIFSREEQEVVKAVDDVSLELYPGEILGLVGESGSGKSTTGRSIMRLTEITSGSIFLDGEDLLALHGQDLNAVRPKFQMIFQDPYASLNPRMTVYDTLTEALQIKGRLAKNEILADVVQLMHDVGLQANQIRKYPHEFSGGQRQRIAIARAIAMQPKLLIADEPVSSLDVTIQAQILELLMALNRKYSLSMIFISHDLSVVRYISDRTAVMYCGKIVELEDTETLFNSPKHPYTKALLSAIPIPDPRKERNRCHITYNLNS